MSRSRKRPWGGIGNVGPGDEKLYKQKAHRQLRRAVRTSIRTGNLDGIPDDRKFGNPWGGPKDGKCRYRGPDGYRK